MEFYLSDETIQRSKFKFLKIKDKINLELPLKYGQKISGHICQGHIDTVGKISNIRIIDKSYLFEFEIIKKERMNLIEKASVCINGISLTISKLVAYKDFNCFKELSQKYKNKKKINTQLGKDSITLYKR